MPSLKIGEIKLDLWEKQKEAGSLSWLNFMSILKVLFVCAKCVHSFLSCADLFLFF